MSNNIFVAVDFSEIQNKFNQGHYMHLDDYFIFNDLLTQLLVEDQVQDCSLINEIAEFISDDMEEKASQELYDQVYNSCTRLCSDIGIKLYNNVGLDENLIIKTIAKQGVILVEYSM
jgi:hypothetical protein